MANKTDEVLIHKYFFGNQCGTFDEDRFKDESVDEMNIVKDEANMNDVNFFKREDEEKDIVTDTWDSDYSIRYTSNCDSNDDNECAAFIEKTCGCTLGCTSMFTKEIISQSRRDFRTFDYYEFGRNQLDLILLGIIHALVKSDGVVKHARRSVEKERQRLKFSFLFRGRKVCGDFFQFVHGVKRKRLHNLLAHYKSNGCNVLERVHKNYLNAPASNLSSNTQKKCVKFIRNYAEDCASYYLGPNSSVSPAVTLLPSDESKNKIYQKYVVAIQLLGLKAVSKKMFYRLWNEHCSDLVIYQKVKSESETTGVASDESADLSQDHLELVGSEPKHYHFIAIPSFNDPVHISFDFAQQIHIPNNPQDPGPVYFLDLYKISIFGIVNETCNRQCKYIIPEAVIFPKSQAVNAMVCYLHHYFQEFTAGEAELDLRAHNFSPQTKNNCLMQYLAWRIAQRLNTKITLTFVPPNLSKLDPNYKFGLFKRQFQQIATSCLNDVVEVLNSSGAENFSFLVGNESGDLYMDVYDWHVAFSEAHFSRIPFITNQSYFYFDERWRGKVKCLKAIDDVMQTYTIFESSFDVSKMSFEKIQPLGLSYERKLYLYEQVRPYCSADTQDIVCPLPSTNIKDMKRPRVE